MYSLGLLREEMLGGEVVFTRQEAEARTFSVSDKNSLLASDPLCREMLPISTRPEARELLAAKVVGLLKKKQANVLRTTVLHNHHLPLKPGPLVSTFLFSLFLVFYAQALHPSMPPLTQKSTKRGWRLDIRSYQWAEVALYKKSQNKKVLVQKQYTPILQKNLTPGLYEIYWSSLSRSGVISVQLNKNQRILLP
jgi:hypothetical protein